MHEYLESTLLKTILKYPQNPEIGYFKIFKIGGTMSGPTSKIKVFTDVKFQPGSTLTRDTRNQFPTNPEVGMDTMVNGVYYYYGAPDGETPMWIPVGNKRSHSTVNVQTPQLDWTIEHQLGTHNVIAVAYDTNGRVMDASFTILSANVIKFTFAIPVAGKVTVFGTSEKFAGYTPYNDSLNQETVEIGITEPDETVTSTLYIQLA